jgi:multicomponent Na+:H+ antiporter subunit G
VKEIAVIVVAAVGLGFSVSGAVGIMRMPDVHTRIQYSSKAIVMGALPALVALLIGEGVVSTFGGRALLIALLLLVANPASSHALARVATGLRTWPGTPPNEAAEQPGSDPPPDQAGDGGPDEQQRQDGQ